MPKDREFVRAVDSSGTELYFPMKPKVKSLENYKGNIIRLSNTMYSTFTELKYNTKQLIDIFGIPNFMEFDMLGKKMLEWKFRFNFENTKAPREYQKGFFIVSTSKTVEKDDISLLNTLKHLNINERNERNERTETNETNETNETFSHHNCNDAEYIPLDSTSKWVLEICFNKYPYEIVDKYAISRQTKHIIDYIELNNTCNLNMELTNLKITN